MNCRSARANFSSYIEQELSEIERRRVAAHLGRCPTCSSELFAMQKAMSLLRWVPRAEGSLGFDTRLMERIQGEGDRVPGRAARLGAWLEVLRQKTSERWDELTAGLALPAPAGALLAALLLGGGGGALVMATLSTPDAPAGTPVAATPEIVSEPHLLAARTSTTNAAAPVAPAAPPTPALAEPAGPVAAPAAAALAQAPPTASPAATPGRSRGSETRLAGRMEVAPWATGGSGQRLEAVPEGPPPVSRVEYVLDRVEMNRNPVALPASVVVQDGSVTF